MSTEEIREKFDALDIEDVAEKRLRMFKIFEDLVESMADKDTSVEALNELKDNNGYLYKLSQDFLLSSSTMDKEKKLEKILEYVERKN